MNDILPYKFSFGKDAGDRKPLRFPSFSIIAHHYACVRFLVLQQEGGPTENRGRGEEGAFPHTRARARVRDGASRGSGCRFVDCRTKL